jgi:hypothetical protein
MTFTLILVALAGLAFLLFFSRTAGKSRTPSDDTAVGDRLRAVDVEAFRNLVDPRDEEFLQANLTSTEFRAIERARMRAAVAYLVGVSHNAGVLLQLGQAARRSPDPPIVEAGQRLVDDAARVRLLSAIAIGKLCLKIALPSMRLQPASVVDRYQNLRDGAALLGRLQDPTKPILASRSA